MSKKQKRSFLRELKRGKLNSSNMQYLEQANEVISIIQDYTTQPFNVPIKALTTSQKSYMESIKNNTITFGCGPAGTGKTYVCGAMASEAISSAQTQKIIITRPVQEAGEHLGFLPGELDDKFAPYFQPFREVMEERLGRGHVQGLLKAGRIEASPLAYMRGRSFKNCWVILDEAQNCTITQMKLFLTRIGENCTVIVNGDETQRDVRGACGLSDAIKRLSNVSSINTVIFTRKDVVRSGIVQQVVEAYEK